MYECVFMHECTQACFSLFFKIINMEYMVLSFFIMIFMEQTLQYWLVDKNLIKYLENKWNFHSQYNS